MSPPSRLVVGVPLYPDWTESESSQKHASSGDKQPTQWHHNVIEEPRRFVSLGFQDVAWAFVFVAHVTGITMVAAYNVRAFVSGELFSKRPDLFPSTAAPVTVEAHHGSSPPSLIELGAGLVIAALVTSLLLTAVRFFAASFIRASITFSVVMCAVMCVSAIAAGSILMAALFALCTVGSIMWYFAVLPRVPFSSYLLSLSSALVARYYGVLVATVVMIKLVALYVAAWIVAIAAAVVYYAPVMPRSQGRNLAVPRHAADHSEQSIGTAALFLAFLFCLFWTVQVASNVIHVTACGLAATYYFAGPVHMPRNPSWASFKRSITTSFGSICFGSAVVAFLQVLRFIAHELRRADNNFIRCIAECLIACVEALVERINVYAFSYMAIYGTSYIESGRRAMDLLFTAPEGFEAIINDCLVLPAIRFAILTGTLLAFLLAFLVLGAPMAAMVAGLTAACLSVYLSSVYAATVTVFLCFADCPSAAEGSNPQLHDDLTTLVRRGYMAFPAAYVPSPSLLSPHLHTYGTVV